MRAERRATLKHPTARARRVQFNYLNDDELAHAKGLLDRMTTIYQPTPSWVRKHYAARSRPASRRCPSRGVRARPREDDGDPASAVSGTFHRIQCTRPDA